MADNPTSKHIIADVYGARHVADFVCKQGATYHLCEIAVFEK